MVCHVKEKEDVDRIQLISMRIFKPTSENLTKRLSIRQEARRTTSTKKNTKAILKQIAIQKFQAKKKNAHLEVNNNVKSCTGITNAKKLFLVRDKSSKKLVIGDGRKNGKIRERNRFF